MLSAILEVIILVFHKQITDFNFVTDFWRTNKTVFTISGSSYCRCLTYAGFHWTINDPCLWWWRHGVAKCCPCCSSSSPSSDWQILLSHEGLWAIHNCYRLVLFFFLCSKLILFSHVPWQETQVVQRSWPLCCTDPQDIKKLVVTHWNETYKGDEEPPLAPESSRRGKVSDFIVTLSLNNNAFILDEVKVG